MNKNIDVLEREHLMELCQFVVRENYSHHIGSRIHKHLQKQVNDMFKEELAYFDSAITYISRERTSITGSIRVLRYNNSITLPLEKLFDIDPLLYASNPNKIFHIGRFAIKKKQSSRLFKSLMVHALSHVFYEENSVLFIECDLKLARILRILNIGYKVLSEPIYYLGSETAPLMITREDIESFFIRNMHLFNSKTTLECSSTYSNERLHSSVANLTLI